MLTQQEQNEVLRMAKQLAEKNVRLRGMVARSEMDQKRYRELMQQAVDDLKDFLKEIG